MGKNIQNLYKFLDIFIRMLYDIRSKKETSKGDNNPMKKVVAKALIFILIVFMILSFTESYALDAKNIEETNTTSNLIEEREQAKTKMDEYIEDYDNNRTYGITAFVLSIIQAYSWPVCFLGVALGAIAQFILGTRKLDFRQRGSRMMLGFLTLFVICQVLPLIFTVVVIGWR
jgi:hypothetical protein